MVSRMAAF